MLKHDAVALPALIQGGMGVAVSSWPLALAVSAAGQLGVVPGTALDAVLARRLQDAILVATCVRHSRASRFPRSPSASSPVTSGPVAARRELRMLRVSLDPSVLSGEAAPPLKRPAFLAVVSAHVLAEYMARDPAMRPAGSSSRDRRLAAITPRRVAGSRWTRRASPATVRAIMPTSRGSPRSGCHSGWPVPMTLRPRSQRPGPLARLACRWARCSPSARNPGSAPTCARNCSTRRGRARCECEPIPRRHPPGSLSRPSSFPAPWQSRSGTACGLGCVT